MSHPADFAATLANLPRHASGSVNWRSMTTDTIAAAFAAAVSEGDDKTRVNASAALKRMFLKEIKSGKHPMLDSEGNA